MSGTELVVEEQRHVAVQNELSFNQEKIDLLKRTICKGATNDELELFMNQCKRLNLDPFLRQIHAVKRYDSKLQTDVMSTQTSIDGFRLIAERTSAYQGQTPAMWCDIDGVWKDVWLSDNFPFAARIGVHKKGFKDPLYCTAHWKEYVQTYQKGNQTFIGSMWKKMPTLMLAKCAEALALRKAFPHELSGIYTSDEMSQAENAVDVQTDVKVDPVAKAEESQEQLKLKRIRAEFNQKLVECKAKEEVLKINQAFDAEQGRTIWAKVTGVRDRETFLSMANDRLKFFDERKDQIETAKIETRKRIESCQTEKEWLEINGYIYNMDDTLLIDLLREKGKEIGVPDHFLEELTSA